MKKEILNRIEQLGGNVAQVKGTSLQEDLCAITFHTALYLKPVDTPWQSAEDTEPITGLGDWVDKHMTLFESDRQTFYQKMVDTYYTLDETPRMQHFWVARPFTPFREGTADFAEWNDWFAEETELSKIIEHSSSEKPDFIELLYTESYPNYYYISLSDLNPENPMVWGTDHEEFFTDITHEGTLEDFLHTFMTKDEFLDIVKRKLEQ